MKIRPELEFVLQESKSDKYNVMRIIGVLREKGVYEDFNDTKYNNILEQTDKDFIS